VQRIRTVESIEPRDEIDFERQDCHIAELGIGGYLRVTNRVWPPSTE
jgi:hypothetical protein